MRTPLCRPTAPNAPAGPSLLTGRVWAMGLMVTSAVWGCGEGTGPNGNGGGNEVTWQVSVLGYAPQPFRLLVRNGSLYWQDVSLDIPLNRLSLADGAYTPYPTVPNPENAVSDGQNLYWVSAGRLYRSSLDGTTTTVLDEGTREFTTAALMMDDSNVYWVNSVASPTCSPACTFTIRQVPKPGGPVRTLATTSQPVVALAIAAGYLFWAEVGTGPVDPDGSSGSAIKKVPLAGGTVTLLVDGLLNGLITHPGPGYHPASWHPGGGIVSDGASVYFADADFVDSYRVMRVSVDGGAVLVLADVTTGDASSVVHDLELDNGTLYWVDGNSVRSLPKAGGSVAQLAGGLVSPTNLTLTGGGTLFWLESACCAHGQKGTIKRMPAGGGAPITVKTGIDAPATVSVDGARVYWVEGGPIGAIEGFGRIARATHDGMDETVVLEATGGGPFDVDATHLYFANGFTLKRVSIGGGKVERLAIADLPISDVATDGTHVYWTSAHTGTVQKMAVNGGPIVTLAPGSGSGHTLRLDGTHVYWIDSDQFIKRVPKSGGPPATVVGPGSVTDFVVHGSHIYLAEWDRARILRAPVGGGEVLELVTLETDQTRRLATDGRLVYWIDQLDLGTVPVGGGPPQYIVLGEIASSPYLASAVAVDDTVVYWTEVVDNVIKMATPK